MAFIYSAKHNSGNEEVNIVSVSTASANIEVASISQDTACAYIASQSSENHALVADEEAPIEFALMAKTGAESKVFDNSLCSKAYKKDTDSLNRLLEFADDTVTDYSKPLPTIESTSDDAQNRNPSVTETKASPSIISPKPFIKFMKATDRLTETKTTKVETAKPAVKYAAMYSKPSKSSNVRGNQRNWINLKSHQKFPTGNTKFSTADLVNKGKAVKPQLVGFGSLHRIYLTKSSSQNNIDDKGNWDSGCSSHMTGNISYLFDYEPFDRGYVSFGQGGCKITGKGTIKTSKLEFENMYFVKDLKYNDIC
nr:hypothetical protein [Tanacetum cinerariifolium]